MALHPLDVSIILGYILLSVLVGFWISKKASKGLKSYFLGDNSLRWYMLGFSNGSGMFDISGTAFYLSMMVVYGVQSAWIPWLWPVWNQVFIMMFLAVWMRRSGVMTGAEWISFRFGSDKGARLAHSIVVIFAVVSVIGFIAYFFAGIGKFAATLLPWNLSFTLGFWNVTGEQAYALIIIGITTVYTIKGGMYSAVATEVMQYGFMVLSCVFVAVYAIDTVDLHAVGTLTPGGWTDFWFGWKLNLDWSKVWPAVMGKIQDDGFQLFGPLVMMMIFKGIFASLAGPVPSFDMQRVLSARSPREAAKMSGFTILILYFPLYLMVTGLALIAIQDVVPAMHAESHPDFEVILSRVIVDYLPVGLRGVIIAGLLAAFMSTFSAFVNAAPAYLVNDFYKKYFRPHESDRHYVRWSYASSVVVVGIGVFFGFYASSLSALTQWITGALYGGYAASNVLKWVWWRFNGYGYFWGMLMGLLASTAGMFVVEIRPTINFFPFILVVAIAGSVVGSLLTRPTNPDAIDEFYRKTRPWGFWSPVLGRVRNVDPQFRPNTDAGRDTFNVLVGIVWQMTLITMPMFLLLRLWMNLFVALALAGICMVVLKFSWFDRLEPDESKP